MRTLKYSITALLFTIVGCLITGPVKAYDSTYNLNRGIADLRSVNFTGNPVTLQGECAFEWKQLFSPGNPPAFTNFTRFPHLWNNTKINGQQLPAEGYATYGFTVLLPRNRPELAMNMPVVYCAYRLFINGKEVAANGNPSANRNSYTPKWVPVTVSLPENTDTIKILLQVANYSHYKGGINLGMEVGEKDQLFLQKDRNVASDFLLAGCVFMGGLFFLALFVFGTKDKATLYFSLFCMMYSYRLVGSGYYSLHAAFPNLQWEFTLLLEYLSLYGCVFLFFQYIRHLYPKDIYKPFVMLVSVISIALSVTSIVAPPQIFTQLLNGFLALTFACILYLVMVFIRAWFRKRVAAGCALMSVGVLMLIQLLSELEYFGIVIPSRLLLFSGHVMFFFLQSLVLSFRFSYALKQSKMLAELGLQAKSEFLSTMSHEIRTPLNSVIGMSNLMLKNNPRPDQQEQLDVLQFSAKNLLGIVNDILDYSKIEAGKITFEEIEMDLPDILRNIVAGAKIAVPEKNIEVNLTVDDTLGNYVMGDPTRLIQVMQNLVGNAVKFTPQGAVSIELAVLEQTATDISLLFTVKDTGIGISAEKQQHIFDEFAQADSSTTRSFGGTGLGLAITKKILLLQGTKLQLTSEPGKGSVFYFTQTCKLSPKKLVNRDGREQLVQPGATLKGITILLVEDNHINILVAKTFLENWGAAIEVAENGMDAIRRVDPVRHQVVLMDLHMPVMDGYTAIREIREKGIDIPIIALTASLPNEVEAEMKGLSISGFILKPFIPEELLRKVTQAAAGFVAPRFN